MEKTKLKRIDYRVCDFCILLAPVKYKENDSRKPYIIERMEKATGKELKESIDVQRLYAIEDPKENGVFCQRNDCQDCKILKGYELRLNEKSKTKVEEIEIG